MYNLNTIDIAELKNGDILCYQKDTYIGLPIQLSTRSKCSHVGIYYDGFIYEAIIKGVCKTPLYESFDKSKSIGVQRLNINVDFERLEDVISQQLGKPYYYVGLLYQLKRQLFGGWKGATDIDSFMCSQLIGYGLNEVVDNDDFSAWYKMTPADIWEDRKNFKSFNLIK